MTKTISKKIDHTLLNSDATEAHISKICAEAAEYDFATVCINPCYIPQAVHLLEGSEVGVTTVVGFPLGAELTSTKAYAAKEAVALGASEVDMVINIAALKDKKYDYVLHDIKSVVASARSKKEDVVVKVILETCLLTDEEIIKGCELVVSAKADFVKTSTGFSEEGANSEVVSLIRKTVGKKIGVKAAGGIRSYKDFDTMVKSGANRVGCSSSVDIINEFNKL